MMGCLRPHNLVTDRLYVPASCLRARRHKESPATFTVKLHVLTNPLIREQEKDHHLMRWRQYGLPDEKDIHFSKDEQKLLESLGSTDRRKTRTSQSKGSFKSVGSRSIPSRSTIPGLRSKYSKPDPKLKKSTHRVRNPNYVRRILYSSDSSSDTPETDEETIDWFDSESDADETETCLPELAKAHSKVLMETARSLHLQKLGTQLPSTGGSAMMPKVVNAGIKLHDGSTEIYAVNDMVSSGPVGEDGVIGSRDCKHTNANYKMEPTDDNQDNLERISAITNVAEAYFWKRHPLCDLPFDIQYSYSETPNAPILGFRDIYSPFGPDTIQRPWTGLPPARRRHLENCLDTVPRKFKLDCYPEGSQRKPAKSREAILGKPLTREEITRLVNNCYQENRQVNLGRDGLTHNMLYLIHTHWKKRPVCKIKCRGVPTVDMENLCFHVEDKTGGKIIYKSGGVLYVFRGRNYSHRNHPRIPLMLWKPASPIYPKVVPKVPAGLTTEEAYKLRLLGQKVEPLCNLGKNAVYLDLVANVREAFKIDDLVALNYEGLNPSDYKKIAAKLRDLVPCTILSFRNRRILLWKGRDVNTSLDGQVHLEDHHSPKSIDVESLIVARPALHMYNINGLHQPKPWSLPDESPMLHSENVSNSSNCMSSCGDVSAILLTKPILKQECLDGAGKRIIYNGDDCEDSKVDDGEERHNISLINEDKNDDSDDCYEVRIHDDIDIPWKLALRCGMALELEDSNIDADMILQKSDTFSRIASAVPDYSEKLINRLRIKVNHETKDEHFEVNFYAKRRKPRKQFKATKQAATFQTSSHRNLQADELIALLSPTR